jgi:transketolase
VLVLSADLTSSTEADLFRDTYPDRFVSCGVAEQNMLSVAGGLSREGFVPFVHTFAVFIYRRAYDQVAMSVAYPNANVKMFGFLPGITTPGGATHQAIEDIAVMRLLPNMTVIECGDATDVESASELAYSVDGPVYVRMIRGEIPRLFPKEQRMALDTPRVLSTGSDIVLLSSGICTLEAMKAAAVLSSKGVSIAHLHISTFKPFNNPIIPQMLSTPKYGIITVENHIKNGGLGSLVAETLASHRITASMARLGIDDRFSHGASPKYLMAENGIDALAVVRATERLTGETLGISESDIPVDTDLPGAATSKAEDL